MMLGSQDICVLSSVLRNALCSLFAVAGRFMFLRVSCEPKPEIFNIACRTRPDLYEGV